MYADQSIELSSVSALMHLTLQWIRELTPKSNIIMNELPKCADTYLVVNAVRHIYFQVVCW